MKQRWRVRENIVVGIVGSRWCYTLAKQRRRGYIAKVLAVAFGLGRSIGSSRTYNAWGRLCADEFGQLGFRTLCGGDGESLDEFATALLIGHSSAKVIRFSVRVIIFVRHLVTLRERRSRRNNGCDIAGFVVGAQLGECAVVTPIVFQIIPHFRGMMTLRKSSERLGSCVSALGAFMFMFDCPQKRRT